MNAWQEFVCSRDYRRMMHEVRALGCTQITTQVWAPSSMTSEPLRAGEATLPASGS